MISYKVKGIVLVVIISLASIMMPFSVYAENIDSHIRGRNYTYEPITYNEIQVSTNTYYENIGVFHITFELDDEYIGYVLPNYSIQYDNYFYGASTPSWGTLTKTFDRRIFVNGSSFSFDVTVNWNSITINSAPGGDPFNYDSYTITSSDVTKYADIDSLDQIINILQDNQDIINDIYGELQTVVSNTSLANQYLSDISLLRQYNYPIESFNVIYKLIYQNISISSYFDINYWKYPVFDVPVNTILYSRSINNNQSLLYMCYVPYNITINNINNYFDINNGFSFSIYENQLLLNNPSLRRLTIKITNSSGSTNTLELKTLVRLNLFIPIFAILEQNISGNYSTDFALNFGLSNQLLDDLHIIANGTNQSDSAASDLEQEASEYSDIADDVIGVEEGLTSNFETSVNQIDLNTGLSGFGGNFMTSATWVRTQFDRLTENTPYGSLVVYGLTLGFVLLMLGKVLL